MKKMLCWLFGHRWIELKTKLNIIKPNKEGKLSFEGYETVSIAMCKRCGLRVWKNE